jgi:hypothetical protein
MVKYTNPTHILSFVALFVSAALMGKTNPPATPLILGTFQFPQTILSVPVPRIYHMGKTIPCEVHEGTKKVTFDLPKQKNVHHFFLLITESIKYELKKNDFLDQQTIDYIYVPAGKAYKYYELKLTHEKNTVPAGDNESTFVKTTSDKEKLFWKIKEKQLPTNTNRIPDEAIVVLYSPEYIDGLSGGTSLELPVITIKPDVIDLAGSAENLYENSIKLQLASLNSDAIHAPLKHAIKQIGQRTLIAPTL